MYQRWRDLLFLHWPVPPELIQPLLPPGLTVDTFEGNAYVGLVPFTMHGVRPVGLPPMPGISDFPECNVRTYVHRGGAGPGVWFFSLDAANIVAVLVARSLWRLPYFFARMATRRDSTAAIAYHTDRLAPPPLPAASRFRYTPTGEPQPATPDTLEFFLAERYILYAYARHRLWRGRVHHTPYPLQTATLLDFNDTSLAADGIHLPIDTPAHPPLVHYAFGVDVDVFPLRPLA